MERLPEECPYPNICKQYANPQSLIDEGDKAIYRFFSDNESSLHALSLPAYLCAAKNGDSCLSNEESKTIFLEAIENIE